ncbi:UNVERIFIED_ORG: hypothetical protein B2H93_04885 [Clostridium botulinum]
MYTEGKIIIKNKFEILIISKEKNILEKKILCDNELEKKLMLNHIGYNKEKIYIKVNEVN